MSSVLAHALAGTIVQRSFANSTKRINLNDNKLLIFAIVCALLPDIDVIILIFSNSQNIIAHRGFTHSLFFCFFAAGIVSFFCLNLFDMKFHHLFFLSSISIFTHLALDYLMGAGPPLLLFAPFSYKEFLSPIRIVPCAYYANSAGGLMQLIFYPPAVIGYLLEFLIFMPIVLYLSKPKYKSGKAVSLIVSVFSLFITYQIYK